MPRSVRAMPARRHRNLPVPGEVLSGQRVRRAADLVGRALDEQGSALVELTWLSLLLMVPMLWMLVSVFEVQRGAFAVSAAARSAGSTGRKRRVSVEVVGVIAKAVEYLTLFLVGEYVVRFLDLFEFVFRPFVIRVNIGMMLSSETTVRFFDLVRLGVFFYPKDLVVIFFGHVSVMSDERQVTSER